MGTSEETLKIVFTAVDKASEPITGINKVLGQMGKLALGAGLAAGTAAIAGLGAGLKFAIDEAIEAQEVMAQLNQVLESTGGVAGVTSDMANDLANSLMQVTRFSDEEILSAETMLLQFTQINKEAFPQAIALSLDLAERLGTDAAGGAQLLGKALADPGQGLLRLKQAGLVLDDEMIEMIKNMADAGDEAGAMKLIMDELGKSVGGAAEAAGETFAGKMEIFHNSIANIGEEVGKVLLPVLTQALTDLSPIILDIAEVLAELVASDEFKQWLTDVSQNITELSNALKNNMIPDLGELKTILTLATLPLKLFYEGWALVYGVLKLVKIQFDNTVEGIKILIAWVQILKNKLKELVIPASLAPGSPSPLEQSFLNVGKAIRQISSLNLPTFTAQLEGIKIPYSNSPLIGGSRGSAQIVINFNSPVIGFRDEYSLGQNLGPIIQKYLRSR